MDGTKITLQNDGRMTSCMVGTKKTSPKDGELNGWHENNSPKEWTTQNNSPKGWTDGKLNGQHDLTFLKDGWQKK